MLGCDASTAFARGSVPVAGGGAREPAPTRARGRTVHVESYCPTEPAPISAPFGRAGELHIEPRWDGSARTARIDRCASRLLAFTLSLGLSCCAVCTVCAQLDGMQRCGGSKVFATAPTRGSAVYPSTIVHVASASCRPGTASVGTRGTAHASKDEPVCTGPARGPSAAMKDSSRQEGAEFVGLGFARGEAGRTSLSVLSGEERREERSPSGEGSITHRRDRE